MAIEINEENDWQYIHNYLKKGVRKDFVNYMQSSGIDSENLKLIYKHFELYNKAISGITGKLEIAFNENENLKSALEFNLDIIKKLQNQSNQNAIEIEKLKSKKSWF